MLAPTWCKDDHCMYASFSQCQGPPHLPGQQEVTLAMAESPCRTYITLTYITAPSTLASVSTVEGCSYRPTKTCAGYRGPSRAPCSFQQVPLPSSNPLANPSQGALYAVPLPPYSLDVRFGGSGTAYSKAVHIPGRRVGATPLSLKVHPLCLQKTELH